MSHMTLNRMTKDLIDAGCPQTDDGVINALLERGWQPDTIAKWYELAREDAEAALRREVETDLLEIAQAAQDEFAFLRAEIDRLRAENMALRFIHGRAA